MKFLATGDIHVHPYQQFSYTRRDGMNSRLYNCLRVFELLRREAKQRGINKILINGDTFHESNWIDTEVFDAVYLAAERIYDEGIEIVFNLGQHDMARVTGGRVLHALRAFCKIARVVEKPTVVWNAVQVVPWHDSPVALKKAIRHLPANPSACLCLHCGVQGAKTGPNDFIVPNSILLRDIRYKEFGVVLLSDYHTRQRLKRNVQYLGSPIQHSFGEIHRPCVWEVSIGGSGGHPRLAKIFTPFPQFRRVILRVGDQIPEALRATPTNSYVKIEADVSQDAGHIERIAERLGYKHIQIVRRGDKQQALQAPSAFDITQAMENYVGDRPDRKRLLQLGSKLYQGESV